MNILDLLNARMREILPNPNHRQQLLTHGPPGNTVGERILEAALTGRAFCIKREGRDVKVWIDADVASGNAS